MLGLSHVLLHVGLCSAVARASPQTTVAMRVRLSYHVGGTALEKTFRFQREDGSETIVELDVPRGIYHMQIDVPKYGCSASDFVDFLPDHVRTITETLGDLSTPPDKPGVLFEGTAPTSFLYVKPTFVLFDKSVACNTPVGTPLDSHIRVENDGDAYYVWLYSDPALEARGPVVVAIRLRTPTGLYHYIRMPITFPTPWTGWPANDTFNISEDNLAGVATEKYDTLLCPHLWTTSVRGQ